MKAELADNLANEEVVTRAEISAEVQAEQIDAELAAAAAEAETQTEADASSLDSNTSGQATSLAAWRKRPPVILPNEHMLKGKEEYEVELAKRLVLVIDAARYVDVKSGKLLSEKQVDMAWTYKMPVGERGRKTDAHKIVKESNAIVRVGATGFHAGEGTFFVDEISGQRTFNMHWAPPMPYNDANPKRGLDHVSYLCGGREDIINHFLDWLAYIVAHRGKKVRHAIVIISPMEGIGKGLLMKLIARILGVHNVAQIPIKHVLSPFNGWMIRQELVVIPEILIRSESEADDLKPKISDDDDFINEKNEKSFPVVNRTNFICFSNRMYALYQLQKGERRFYPIVCSADKMSPEYYAELSAWIDGDGPGAFAKFLLDRAASKDYKFDPDAPPPLNEDKVKLAEESETAAQAAMGHAMRMQLAPFGRPLVYLQNVVTHFAMPQHGGHKMRNQDVSAYLSGRFGATSFEQFKSGGAHHRIWCLREQEFFQDCYDHGLRAFMVDAATPEKITGVKLVDQRCFEWKPGTVVTDDVALTLLRAELGAAARDKDACRYFDIWAALKGRSY